MKYTENYGVTKQEIETGFTEGRSKAMIQEENIDKWEALWQEENDKERDGFLKGE